MIYVMSDIHGQKEMFERMLKLIEFNNDDTLHLLGDVIDRGPDGIKMLLKIMRTPNIYMLLGNHELMMLNSLIYNDVDSNYLWMRNGGKTTLRQLNKYAESTKNKIIKYIKSLPVEKRVNVNNQEFVLCHAQPHPSSFQNNPFNVHSISYQYETDKEFSVWQRHTIPTKESPYKEIGIIPDENFNNKIVIFGHTPVFNYPDWQGVNSIKRVGNTINIDCGCAAIEYNNNELNGRIGCLRLDDQKEFYV